MKRELLTALLALAISAMSAGATTAAKQGERLKESAAQTEKMRWWRDAHFGMFVHWGPYAQWGGVYNGYLQRVGDAAWIMNRCKIPVAEYQERARHFNPEDFNADSIAALAKGAGMKYLVLTAKHHDGFAMFQSDASEFNIADFTPFGRDVVGELAEACKNQGMKFGIYYSQLQDWNNPGGTTHRRPMSQGWPNPEAEKIDAYTEAHGGSWDPAQQTRSRDEYFEQVALGQVRELLERHGDDISVIFWDTPSAMTEEYARAMTELLENYPHIITNDRLIRGSSEFTGDYKTPEQTIPSAKELDGTDWETCMTICDSWGYKARGTTWKPAETLIHNLVDIVSKGGNFLLNIGPDGKGNVPAPNIDRLKEIGKWMEKYGEAVYGVERMTIKKPEWGYCSQKQRERGGTTVYLYIDYWPEKNEELLLKVFKEAASARMLHNGEPVAFRNSGDGVYLTLPERSPGGVLPVVALEFNTKLPRFKRKPMNNASYEIVDEPETKPQR
ncbi:MAG: alpha-L-fucosidase [[Clostridium] fimetarium]|nr:alpha-L-fucosidase [Alistipes timonensis]MCM1405111.1 alpha-L-fucosidase [[Clostridium] fimetarium]